MLNPDEFVSWVNDKIQPGNVEDLKNKLEDVKLDRRTLFGVIAASFAVPNQELTGGGSNFIINDFVDYSGPYKHMVSC